MASRRKRRFSQHDKTGRSTGGGKHVRLYIYELASPAYRSLGVAARALLIELRRRHNGANNGRIPLSVREAMTLLGVGRKATGRAFSELQDRGFVRVAVKGLFTTREATRWTLTNEPVGGNPATKEFMRWSPDGVVQKQDIVSLGSTSRVPREHQDPKIGAEKPPHGVPREHQGAEKAPAMVSLGNTVYRLPYGTGNLLSASDNDTADEEPLRVVSWSAVQRARRQEPQSSLAEIARAGLLLRPAARNRTLSGAASAAF